MLINPSIFFPGKQLNNLNQHFNLGLQSIKFLYLKTPAIIPLDLPVKPFPRTLVCFILGHAFHTINYLVL